MLTGALLAFAITVAVCPVVVLALRRSEIVDLPNARSSHHTPTPRGAGIAVGVGALCAASFSPALSTWRMPLILVSAAFGLLGLVEDVFGVPSIRRLFAQALLAAVFLPLLVRDLSGPLPWRLLFIGGVLLWLVSYVNAFNFMDGINGISAMQVVVAGAAWAIIGQVEEIPALACGSAIITGAAVGFAPFNFPRARAFLGDAGSYFLGAWLAVLVVVGLRAGLPAEAVLAPLGVALVDTLWAILRRVRRGARWHEPHREHVYQRLVLAGWSHTATTLFVGVVLGVSSALGATTLATEGLPGRVAADVAIGILLFGYLKSPDLVPGLSGRPSRPGLLTTRRRPERIEPPAPRSTGRSAQSPPPGRSVAASRGSRYGRG